MSNNQNRWWESYLVRYLVGNIFAVLVLFYLFINYDKEIGDTFCEYDKNTKFCQNIENNSTTFSKEVFGFIFQSSKEINSSNPILAENMIKLNNDVNNSFKSYEIIVTDTHHPQIKE